MKNPLLVAALASILPAQEAEPTPAATTELTDQQLVENAARDYIEGLYQAAPDRIRRSVHPELTKYGFSRPAPDRPYGGSAMTFDQLVALAGRWNAEGNRVDETSPRAVEVLGVLPEIALAKVTATWGIDYMQIAKEDGKWQIRHILWQRHPGEVGASYAGPAEDVEAIEAAGHDYVRAFYRAEPERVDRSVHPELTKYGFYQPAGAPQSRPMPMDFGQLRQLAATLHKTRKAPADALDEVRVIDVLDQTAAAEIRGSWGIDYVHLAKFDGRWQILHVLWQSHPRARPADSSHGNHDDG